jgi:ABC-type multidrug transport system fused ATPase/permease subunit
MKIPIITDFIHYSRIIWKIARLIIPLYVLNSFICSFIEGIGFIMFVPIINQMNVSGTDSNVLSRYIDAFFNLIGIEMTLNSILVVTAVILLFAGIAAFFQNMLRNYLKASLKRNYKIKLLKLFEKTDYRQILNSSTGYSSNLIGNETGRAISAVASYCMLVAKVISTIIYMCLAMLLSWQITIVGIVCSGIVMILMRKTFGRSRAFDLEFSRLKALLSEYLIQTIQSFKYLKSTNNLHNLRDKITSVIDPIFRFELKSALQIWLLRTVLQLFSTFIVLIMIYYMVSVKGNSIGSVLVLALVFHRTINTLSGAQKSWQGFLASTGGLITVEDACARLSQNVERNGAVQLKGFKDSVVMKQVCYAYGDIEALHNVNVEIGKNRTIAIVGESGAGKSTFVDLITGVLKPTAGKILIDGKDYSNIELSSLRDLIGYVTQEIVVFNDSIRNNISFWSREMDNTDTVELAAKHANCEEFILDTPSQYNTYIGDRGLKLSGGQRQRLAIARELYRRPEILILDEATSALDSKSEAFIQQSIDSLKHNKTIIIIAHRLSTVKNSDYIYVLNKGSIIEHGTFATLYNNEKSQFRNMCNMQKL